MDSSNSSSDVIAGVVRTLSFNSIIILKSFLKYWFRNPVRLFKPSRVRKYSLSTVPLMAINSVSSILLFNSFSMLNSKTYPEIAGGIAGGISSLVSVPLDNFQKHPTKFNEIKITAIFKNYNFLLVREMACFAVFFGVFERSSVILNKRIKFNEKHSRPIAVVLAGSVAGGSYATTLHVFNKFHDYREVEGMIRKPHVIFKGLGFKILKAVPPAAIALSVYELMKHENLLD